MIALRDLEPVGSISVLKAPHLAAHSPLKLQYKCLMPLAGNAKYLNLKADENPPSNFRPIDIVRDLYLGNKEPVQNLAFLTKRGFFSGHAEKLCFTMKYLP